MENTHYMPPAWQRLRVWQVSQLVGMGKSTIWAKAKDDPSFPKPVKISPKVTVWNAEEVRHWLDSKNESQSAEIVRAEEGCFDCPM